MAVALRRRRSRETRAAAGMQELRSEPDRQHRRAAVGAAAAGADAAGERRAGAARGDAGARRDRTACRCCAPSIACWRRRRPAAPRGRRPLRARVRRGAGRRGARQPRLRGADARHARRPPIAPRAPADVTGVERAIRRRARARTIGSGSGGRRRWRRCWRRSTRKLDAARRLRLARDSWAARAEDAAALPRGGGRAARADAAVARRARSDPPARRSVARRGSSGSTARTARGADADRRASPRRPKGARRTGC